MRIKLLVLIFVGLIAACTDANVVSRNLSKSSDMFEIDRRVVFYNGITGEYMLTIEGRCSIAPDTIRVAITCKTGFDSYKKHYLGLSDNVTYFAEQLETANVDSYRYRVVFKPAAIIPDIDFRTR